MQNSKNNINPVISIIVAVYNGAKTLEQCINSVANQCYPNLELIIIDGGSTDGTLDIIQKYEDVISFWLSEPDGGIYDAWNKGLKQVHGEWICFLGSDDYFWQDRAVEQIANTVNLADLQAKLVYSKVAIVNAQHELLYTVGEPWESAKIKLGDVMSVPHPGMLHHHTWFKKYGLFDTSYQIAGDYEMLFRGWPQENAAFVSDVIVVGMMQGGVSSMPRNAIRQLKEVWRAQKMRGKRFPGRLLVAAMTRVYMRLIIQTFLTKHVTYRLLDIGRKFLGKPPYWTKI